MTELILPAGVDYARDVASADERLSGRGVVVNETALPDELVLERVQTYIEEHASMLGVNQGATSFQTYANRTGSLLARARFRTPTNVIDEIVLARDLAERDDDVGNAIGAMSATAFAEEFQHTHRDEVTVALFDEIAKFCGLDDVFAEMYRELLIASQVTTAHAFVRDDFQFQPEGADRQRTRSIVAALVGVLPAEQLRVIDNDLFRTGTLAYKPATGEQERWLSEYFSDSTSAARKAEMRRQDPVLTSMLLGKLDYKDEQPQWSTDTEDPCLGQELYLLNPRMVARSSFPKGSWKYPRPLLTRNFALLEAKRLLNIMDYALLQGGSNFLVVAKKGTDQRPALPDEVANLRDTIKRASTSGVIIGDHRLNIEIITPDLKELLNPEKRKLLGHKLASTLLRLPELGDAGSGSSEAVRTDVEMLSRVITGDRGLIRRHIVNKLYDEIVKRNPGQFPSGAAKIWQPKVVLQGTQYFTDYILKMRDRGDISRHSAVAAGGFDYEAEVQARKREKADDRIMQPAQVPFSAPGQGPLDPYQRPGGGPGPQDNGPGRPRGASPNNGSGAPNVQRDPPAQARPTRVIHRNAGETVRAMWDEEYGTYRVGELTYAVLEQFEDTKEIGRVTAFERRALERIGQEWGAVTEGPLTVVPVNPGYETEDLKAVRLAPGLSVLVGSRVEDGALVARAFVFREPEFSPLDGQERALRWGFPAEPPRPELPAPEEHAAAAPTTGEPVELHVHVDGRRQGMRVVRDKDGNVVGSVPLDEDEDLD